MYSSAETRALQDKTEALKAKKELAVEQLEELRAVLRFHEYRYYVASEPLIADAEYDQLYKQLEKIEKAHPELITPDSPSQRVGLGLSKSFPTVQHLVPMLSLENSYNADDLVEWDRKARELSGLETIEYCIEPKFDGASISLIYENDLLVRGVTRGDGVAGDEITTNIRQIRSIPLSAPFSKYGIQTIEIRGEIIMTKQSFEKYNEKLAEKGEAPLANPRNAASGSLRMKDPREVAERNLEAFLYHVSYYTTLDGFTLAIDGKSNDELPDENLKTQGSSLPSADSPLGTHSGSLKLLWECGFRSPQKEKQVLKGIAEVTRHVHDFEVLRDELPYEIDGMVIKVNDLTLQDRLGMTTHHPRWAMAYKFKARQATTKLRAIEFQVGRTGAVTPVAKVDPVSIGGVTVGSASVHNEEYIREKGLKIGDTVLVERAGDVIPQIVQCMPDLRNGSEVDIAFPRNCPVCDSELTKEEAEAVWRCPNIECRAQVLERMIHFVSKDAMDIRSLGAANILRFYEAGLLKDVPGIYQLDFDEIAKLEKFGKKSIDNLRSAIEASKTQPLHRLIYALGIRFVGETTAKTLANAVHDILELKDKTEEELQQLEDVGVKVARSIYAFFSNEQNIHMLEHLKQLGVQMLNNKKSAVAAGADTLHGQTFLFTGTMPTLKRSEAEAMAEAHGGKIVSGVSSKLDYLVVGEDAGSKLEKAKKINTIKIIDEATFLKLVGEQPAE
ncbi:DNA ligase (NAD+) [Filimonas zeae]|uniref:DNA ligase n=1 Tax=Filimonas zeae TaxID=1737353 RepID=A0A917J3K7_9BACT|nr:NAD-dependent DNA ligase LigA [Filimonas zeae]MDR6342282.1 DNA ligase (NAD+) [Filimonas zeae]GGH80716.1 DNA ligase [Filimonas zeae]